MMFAALFNKIDNNRLKKIAILLSGLQEHRQQERAKQDVCTRRLKRYSKPACGMELHHGYFEEKYELERETQKHAYAISRDDAAYSVLLKRSLSIQQRIQRRSSVRRSVAFSLHRSASSH